MLVMMLVAACNGSAVTPAASPTATGQSATPTQQTPATPTVRPDPTGIPNVDISRHTVPLEDVVFDTFNGSFVELPDADERLILRLRDAIKPIYEPLYEPAEQAVFWLDDGDTVIGIEIDDQAYAYPVKTLSFREIVNEVIGGRPLVITYCPLCASGVVYDRRLDGRTLLFGNTSALYEFDMVMFDHQTGSYWHQLSGQAIVGTLAGEELEALASMVATFGEWRELYPDTLVLANGKVQAPLTTDPTDRIQATVNRGEFRFPVKRGLDDDRLELGRHVLLLRLSGQWKAYPLNESGTAAYNDLINEVPLAVFTQGLSAGAFLSIVDGQRLTFAALDSPPSPAVPFQDEQTGSTWDLAGRAVAGPLQGTVLKAIPSRRGFWFAVAGVNPGIDLYSAPSSGPGQE